MYISILYIMNLELKKFNMKNIKFDSQKSSGPVIVLIGTVLNSLSVSTFTQPTLLKKPISFLFIILAVVDTNTLLEKVVLMTTNLVMNFLLN